MLFIEKPRFINEMLNLLGWQNRTKFRKKYVYPLLQQVILEMTIPNKPSSPKQKYTAIKKGVKLLRDIQKSQ